MQLFSILLASFAFTSQAKHIGAFAGDATRAVASPKTIINLGQLQAEKKNTIGHTATSFDYMPEYSEKEMPLEGQVIERPAVIKGCYKETPIYKTHYKTIQGFNTVKSQVKEMVPETKVVKSFRTVSRVVKDVVPEFKTVEYLRPEYRTVTHKVPFTKEIPYKVKSVVTEPLPPSVIPEPHISETIQPTPCAYPAIHGSSVGSPEIKVKVGSITNQNQA
ncbi:hypothetical protein L0F63_005885 [Massospora cicadina]|nr:hypothetical protein L0F63_005885 [Massospora cicadina]